MTTFSEAFCRRHNLPPERYVRAVLTRSMYPHARLVAPIIRLLSTDHFTADIDLVRGVGRIRSPRDFQTELADFAHHPANEGFLRETLRLRVSAKRLQDLVKNHLARPASPP